MEATEIEELGLSAAGETAVRGVCTIESLPLFLVRALLATEAATGTPESEDEIAAPCLPAGSLMPERLFNEALCVSGIVSLDTWVGGRVGAARPRRDTSNITAVSA
jgi:hypothetical protein